MKCPLSSVVVDFVVMFVLVLTLFSYQLILWVSCDVLKLFDSLVRSFNSQVDHGSSKRQMHAIGSLRDDWW